MPVLLYQQSEALRAIQQALVAGDAKVALQMLKGLGVLGAEAGSDDMKQKTIFIRQSIERFLNAGFNDYFTKRIVDESLLVNAIERWLSGG